MKPVNLVLIGEPDFDEYRRRVAKEYAREKVVAGAWSEAEAQRRAEREIQDLLPEGVNSPDHHIYEIRVGARLVGNVWLRVREESGKTRAWIFDLVVHEEFRGKGIGIRAMRTIEDEAKRLGAEEMGLHVFAQNEAALRLYEKSGYAPSSIVMSKKL